MSRTLAFAVGLWVRHLPADAVARGTSGQSSARSPCTSSFPRPLRRL